MEGRQQGWANLNWHAAFALDSALHRYIATVWCLLIDGKNTSSFHKMAVHSAILEVLAVDINIQVADY